MKRGTGGAFLRKTPVSIFILPQHGLVNQEELYDKMDHWWRGIVMEMTSSPSSSTALYVPHLFRQRPGSHFLFSSLIRHWQSVMSVAIEKRSITKLLGAGPTNASIRQSQTRVKCYWRWLTFSKLKIDSVPHFVSNRKPIQVNKVIKIITLMKTPILMSHSIPELTSSAGGIGSDRKYEDGR